MIVFGPPNVTLHCSADYVNLKRQIEVSWKPILLNNKITEPLSTEEVKNRIQNCGAVIICNGGYKTMVSIQVAGIVIEKLQLQSFHSTCEE